VIAAQPSPAPRRRHARAAPRAAAWLAAICLLGLARRAAGHERQWRAGADFGYLAAGFVESTVNGFGGGAHLSYGLTDAFNLRLHADVSAFDLPDPESSAVVWSAGVGPIYVIDVLSWVPYVGTVVGPAYVGVQDTTDSAGAVLIGADSWHVAVELPLGLGYQLSPHITIGFEGRYRLLLPEGDLGPASSLVGLGRLEYVWSM